MKGNRRLIFMAALMLTSAVLAYFGKLSTEFVSLWSVVGLGYMGSDSAEKWAKRAPKPGKLGELMWTFFFLTDHGYEKIGRPQGGDYVELEYKVLMTLFHEKRQHELAE